MRGLASPPSSPHLGCQVLRLLRGWCFCVRCPCLTPPSSGWRAVPEWLAECACWCPDTALWAAWRCALRGLVLMYSLPYVSTSARDRALMCGYVYAGKECALALRGVVLVFMPPTTVGKFCAALSMVLVRDPCIRQSPSCLPCLESTRKLVCSGRRLQGFFIFSVCD